MSTLRPKRSWSKRPRSSHLVQEVISSAPPDTPAESTSAKLRAKEAAHRDDPLLKSTRKLVCDAEELFSHNVKLSDPRIQAIRQQVENNMPKLYQLSQRCAPSHTSSHTSLIIRTAENFLKRFPDAANSAVLRPHNSQTESQPQTTHAPSTGAHLSPVANGNALANVSPPQVMLAQPAVPNSRLPQPLAPNAPGAVATSAPHTSQAIMQKQSPGVQSLARPQAIPTPAHPCSTTPSTSAFGTQPASYPHTRILHAPGVSRPPVWGSSYETTSTQSHLHEAAKHTTQHQKMVLFAVHDMLRKRSSQHTRQPWYEPPIGLSPEELINAQERRNDPRFHRPNFGGQFPRYLPQTHPPHSSAGTPYPFQGTRSVAVGRSIPRSPSLE